MGNRTWAGCRRGAAAVLGVVSVLAVGGAGAPAQAQAPASQLVPCSQAASRVTITVSSRLDPSCTYTGGFDIAASGVVFDCAGALIRNTASSERGIEITTPVDVSMSDVTVRGCRVEGFLNSLRVTRVGFRTLAAGQEYDRHLADVLIEDSEFRDARGVGIFVDGYVSDVTIRDNVVTGAGSAGIYLEAGSKDNVVEGNVVHDNGFRENGPNGTQFNLGGQTFRFWGPGREGLAIDGSRGNVVVGNSFEGNAAGGIFLYTNCGEFWQSRPERYFQRRFGADDNVIEGNSFVGGEHGVWVGSRMGENTFPMECKDRAYSTGPLTSIALDLAADNVVRGNSFDDVTYGVRVEDDGTTVADNTFTAPDATHHAVVVGTRVRTTALGRPVRGTTVTGNVSTIAGNANPYRWVHGVTGFSADRNTALGRAVTFCESPQLPFNPLIFVHAVVAEDPNGPPAPKPNYVVPTLGALPACQAGPVPTIAPGAASVVEGDGGTTVVEVPVTLSAPSSQPVSALWSTRQAGGGVPEGTPEVDYAVSSGVVRFAPGQTTATIAVPVVGDTAPEPDELVVVAVNHPTNARMGGFWGLGFATVTDDDTPVVVPGSTTVVEGDAGVVAGIPVALSKASSAPVTVDWTTVVVPNGPAGQASAGVDYETASGTLTFAPGQTTATVPLTVLGDDAVEAAQEYALVAFSNPVGARIGGFYGLGGVWIADDDG